jgi:hypothetical protein
MRLCGERLGHDDFHDSFLSRHFCRSDTTGIRHHAAKPRSDIQRGQTGHRIGIRDSGVVLEWEWGCVWENSVREAAKVQDDEGMRKGEVLQKAVPLGWIRAVAGRIVQQRFHYYQLVTGSIYSQKPSQTVRLGQLRPFSFAKVIPHCFSTHRPTVSPENLLRMTSADPVSDRKEFMLSHGKRAFCTWM